MGSTYTPENTVVSTFRLEILYFCLQFIRSSHTTQRKCIKCIKCNPRLFRRNKI